MGYRPSLCVCVGGGGGVRRSWPSDDPILVLWGGMINPFIIDSTYFALLFSPQIDNFWPISFETPDHNQFKKKTLKKTLIKHLK